MHQLCAIEVARLTKLAAEASIISAVAAQPDSPSSLSNSGELRQAWPDRRAGFSAARILDLEAVAQPLRGNVARGVAGQAERIGNGRPEQRIAKGIEDQ